MDVVPMDAGDLPGWAVRLSDESVNARPQVSAAENVTWAKLRERPRTGWRLAS
jgi:hypothetical protein